MAKRVAGVKRKVAQLEAAANDQLLGAEKKLSQMKSKPNKVTSALEKLLSRGEEICEEC
jgi:hypothetical protein